ncbi:MAG: RHS repeat-associated core domain-containing protein, partial [Limisphaerales bacterium]
SAQGAGGVGGLLEVSDAVNGVSFVAYDGNGNVAGLVAANGGGSSAVYEYGPFGEVLRATGPMAKNNPFRFSTKYDDDETGLLYYGYRYYNASTGRWLSRDPVEEPGFTILNSDGNTGDAGPALYGFVGNDPVDDTDDLGLLDHKFEVVTGSVGPTTVFGGTGVWGQPFWCASGSASVSADDASSQVAVVNRKYPWGPGAGNACNTPAGSQTSSGTIKLLLRNCAPGKFRVDMGYDVQGSATGPQGYGASSLKAGGSYLVNAYWSAKTPYGKANVAEFTVDVGTSWTLAAIYTPVISLGPTHGAKSTSTAFGALSFIDAFPAQ